MQLNDFMAAIDNKIVEGGDGLQCYSENNRFIEAENKYGFATAYYDPETLLVHEVHVSDLLNRSHTYNWVDPDFRVARGKWNEEHDIKNEYTETHCQDDILKKVVAILNNRSFDDTVVIDFDLPDVVRTILEEMAFEQNITWDKLIENILMKYIEETNEKNSTEMDSNSGT